MERKYKLHPWPPFTVLFPLPFLIDIPSYDAVVSWMPGAILNLEGLGDHAAMRPPSGEDEVSPPIPKTLKEKKRKRISPSDTPKSKKSKARKSKNDTASLPADSTEVPKAIEPLTIKEVQPRTEGISEGGPRKVPESSEVEDASHHDEQSADLPKGASFEALRNEKNAPSDLLGEIDVDDSPPLPTFSEEKFQEAQAMETPNVRMAHKGEDLFHGYFMGVENAFDMGDASSIFDEAHRLLSQVQQKAKKIEQLREEAKMKEVETLRWKQNMERLASEKDTARAQLSSAECKLQSMKEESLVAANKIEELKAQLVAEFAKATSEAERVKAEVEVIVAVYRADAKAAQVRAKESRRETLEEIHACGFDLTIDIENAKILEDESKAMVSSDDDSGSSSESESGEDEDEAPGED
uniref:Uncharacterized protein n=1 Tax=Nicotiana tabacum TaxID=4097 RepID=A0A1S4DE87_TOBAC|nr:PREDICTED: uncharacterized protein LOC107828878 [Nicotiana tabacum]